MKKRTLVALALFGLSFSSTNATSVYICKSDTAEKYHFAENCRGLRACKHEIIKMSLAEAKTLDRTLCGWED